MQGRRRCPRFVHAGWWREARRPPGASRRWNREARVRGIRAARVAAVHPPPPGITLVELLIVFGIVATVTAMALPLAGAALEQSRASAAAHYVAARLHLARSEAIARSANVALKVETEVPGYPFALYRDGNGNGVLTREARTGVDPMIAAPDTLAAHFAGVTFGFLDGIAPIDGGPALEPGSSPIRAGPSAMVSFSALGGATPSTLYICGRGNYQFAVRVLGDTGRIRILQYSFHTRKWTMQ